MPDQFLIKQTAVLHLGRLFETTGETKPEIL